MLLFYFFSLLHLLKPLLHTGATIGHPCTSSLSSSRPVAAQLGLWHDDAKCVTPGTPRPTPVLWAPPALIFSSWSWVCVLRSGPACPSAGPRPGSPSAASSWGAGQSLLKHRPENVSDIGENRVQMWIIKKKKKTEKNSKIEIWNTIGKMAMKRNHIEKTCEYRKNSENITKSIYKIERKWQWNKYI